MENFSSYADANAAVGAVVSLGGDRISDYGTAGRQKFAEAQGYFEYDKRLAGCYNVPSRKKSNFAAPRPVKREY